MINIVLLEPEMPANTGNIGRTCCAAGAKLHLIEPMGFRVNDKMIKRAGLDYWNDLDVEIYDCYSDFLIKNPAAAEKMYMATTKAKKDYTDVNYESGRWYTRRNTCKFTGNCHKNTNEQKYSFFKFVKFCCYCII